LTLAPATRPKATRTEASTPVGRRRSPSSGAPAGVPLYLLQSTEGARIEAEARPERGGRAPPEPAAVAAPTVEGAPAEAPIAGTEVAAPTGGAAPVVQPHMPAPPERLGPEAQQRLEATQQAAGETAVRAAALPSAARTTQEARAAVTEPAEQRQAEEEAALMSALEQRPEPSPEIEALCQRIYEVIRAKRPPDEDSLLSAEPEAAARAAGAQLDGVIENDTARLGGQYDALAGGAEAGNGSPGEALEAPITEVTGPGLDATGAAPDPVPVEDLDLGADVEDSARRLDEAGMNTEPAGLVQGGPIAEAREAHGELEATAERGPPEVIAEQQAAIERAQADMATLQAQALAAMRSARTGTIVGSTGQQTSMVGSEEQMRRAAAERAESIFAGAQDQVRALLEPLPRTAMARWEAELPRLSREFREHLGRVQRWIDERHAGIVGAVVEIADSILGYPAWVVDEYDAAEQRFGDGVCDVIRDISRDINAVIAAAEALITDARRRIDEVFAALPSELQGWAAEQRQGFSARLDALQAEAHQARDDFNHQLAERASGAVQEVRQEIHQLRVEAGGLLGRIEAAIEVFLDDPVRFIIEGLLALVGIPPASFWAVVDRLGDVIAGIADDPLGFAGNLLEALAQGFTQFFDNIAAHLLQGLQGWLFSKMSSVGVQLPTDLSLGSVITFFLQLMGLTWDNIREILARHIGEENVALLEQAFEVIAVLVEQGPRGIYEMIKDQLDPAVIFDAVMDAAIDMVVEALITQATVRILAMLNPAGAILQAIEAIYRVLRWVFENAAQIFSLVETIVNGAWDIMNGNIGGMAGAVERSLAGLLPPVIDFLASYVGLGDLPERIAEVIRGLQEWVLGLVDRVVGFIVAQARRLLAALGLGGEEEDDDEEAEELSLMHEFSMDGEDHRLMVSVSGDDIIVEMSSAYLAALRRQVLSAIDEEEGGQNRGELIALLERSLQYLRELEEMWVARHYQEQPEAAVRDAINVKLNATASCLQGLGQSFHIKNLQDMGHPSRYVVGSVLKPEYARGRIIRDRFYPTGFTSAVLEWKRIELVRMKTRPGFFVDALNQQEYPEGSAEIDHYNPTVVDHWNRDGNNMDQDRRRTYYNDARGLRVISKEMNGRLGRQAYKDGSKYTANVGPDFRGPDDE
jgi:hypothetical protein